MKKLLLVVGSPVLVLAVIVIVTIVSPASGGSSESNTVQPAPPKCDFGYVDLPASKAKVCVPTLFTVQHGDTLSEIAEWMGSASGWRELCRYRNASGIFEISFPGYNPHRLLPGDRVGGCPRNARDLSSVDQRMK